MAVITTFEELDCWKVSTELRRYLAKLIKTFPLEEKYGLISQIRRASRSVTNNIAEGFGRYHYKENVKFCRISRGSLSELVDHLIIARDEEYIDDSTLKDFKGRIQRCNALLNGYINYLIRAKIKSGKVNEPTISYYITDNG
jgi:four helix bundle protein